MTSSAMRRIRWLIVAACVSGCHSATPPARSEQERADASVRANTAATAPSASHHAAPARPRLRVGTSFDYAPFSTRDPAGQVQGFDAEIAEVLARDLGLELEWVSFRWPTLQAQIEHGELDLAMGGVTWQPTRAVIGYMTRAVARGGPCLLGDANAARVAVNRGGVLEAWSRAHLAGRELVTVEVNQSLPELLASGRVGAIVTDSFERRVFARPGWAERCEPALSRKVYWLAPHHEGLAARIDNWLRDHQQRVEAAQARWFGERQPLSALSHLTDLLARRMAFMPLVAAAKAKEGLPVEDLPREKLVLDAAAEGARKARLPEAPAQAFFALQIELSKAVQRRSIEPATLDLAKQIRPALNELGDRILSAVAEASSAGELSRCGLADLEVLTPWLTSAELKQLLEAIKALAL
jgi:cyclohexadienyl dehydratase